MARTIVGEAFIQILPTDGGVTPGVQKIIDNLPKAVNVPVTANTEQASQAVAGLAAQIEGQIGGSWQAAAAEAAVFTATVFGVKAAIEGAVNSLAGLFDQLAQAQAGFTAILGSQSAGQRLLDDIREFARVSPFVTQELVNYSQQLLGVGQSAESIIPLLKSTGDLIASVGGDTQNISRVLFTLTQIRSIGRLVGQDAIQLQSALVPITKLLADFLGKTTAEVKKLQEQGSISADTVFAAITNAGSKVEGAMNNATRNISGARSVLGDTVKIMAQDSVVLNEVFDDVVQGILKFAEALGSNQKLQADLASIDASLVKVYNDLQPLLEAFSETGASVAISTLDILASALEVLASALNSIPEGVMEQIGRGLAILFALKAPFMLFRYVTSLQQLAAGLKTDMARQLTATAAGIEATGQAGQRAAFSLNNYSVSITKAVNAATAAAFAFGLFADKLIENDEAAKVLGDTLTTGALGAQIGTAIAPGIGTLIGAVGGAGVGLVTSLIGNARAEAERRAAEFEEIGSKAAEKFLAGFKLTTPDIDTGADFNRFFDQTAGLRDQVEVYDKLIQKREELQDIIDEANAVTGTLATPQEANRLATIQANINQITERLNETEESAESARAELSLLFSQGFAAEAITNLATKLSALKKESEAYVTTVTEFANQRFPQQQGLFSSDFSDELARTHAIAILTGDAMVKTADDIALIDEIARQAGLSIDAVLLLPLEELAQILEGKVPDAITKTRLEIIALNTVFDEASKAMKDFFDPFAKQVGAAQAALTAQNSLAEATEKFSAEQTEANALAYAAALLKVSELVATANENAFKGTGVTAGIEFINTQLEILRDNLKLTDPEFQVLLQNLGLTSLALDTGVEPGFVGSISELVRLTGLSEERLKDLIPSLRDVGGADFTVPNGIIDMLERVSRLDTGIKELPGVGADAFAELEENIRQTDFLGGAIGQVDTLTEKIRGLSSAANPNAGGSLGLFGDFDVEAMEIAALEWEKVLRDTRNADIIAAEKKAAKDAEDAAKEAERLRKEAERLAEEARREAERVAREQERLAEEARREAERIAEAYRNSNEALQDALLNASQQIADAAKGWTASIKERTQQEQAVSVTRLIRNAGDQAAGLEELNRAMQTLEQRGLTSQAQDALGIDNIADLRQVRRLLQASGGELAQLSSLVALRDSNAEAIARRERQQETQATIVAAIVQAAGILGYEITPERAAAIAMSIQVTGDASTALLPTGIIEQIQNAGVLLRT